METEEDLQKEAEERNKYGTFIAGLVFLNTEDTTTRTRRDASEADVVPKHIKYKIRMDIDSVESTLEKMTL